MFEEGEISHAAAAFKAKMAGSFRHGRPPLGFSGRQSRLKRLHNNINNFQDVAARAGPHYRRFGSHDRVMRGHNAEWQTRQPRNQDEEYWSDSSSDNQQQPTVAASKAEPAAATLLISMSGENKRECFEWPKRLPSTGRRHRKAAAPLRRSYDHSPLPGPARGKRAEMCKYYANGNCARGSKCFYLHSDHIIKTFEQPAGLTVRQSYRCSSQEPPPAGQECEPFIQEKRGRANSLDDYSPEPAAAGFDLQKALLKMASKSGQVLLSALPDFQLANSSNASRNMSSLGSATSSSSSDTSVNFTSIAALLAFTTQSSEANPPSPSTSKPPQSLRELLGISYL